jgi:hypothetical protein
MARNSRKRHGARYGDAEKRGSVARASPERHGFNYGPWILVIGGLVVVLLLALIYATVRGKSPALIGTGLGETPQVQVTPANNSPEIPRVTLGDAKAAYDARQAIFVDVRGAEPYAAAHIPDALSISAGEIASRVAELDRAAGIITYCN